MLEDNDRPGPEEVLEDYHAAGSPEEWLVDEVCNYLFRDVPEGELTDRIGKFDEVISEERETLLENTVGINDIALFTVAVDKGEDSEFISFRGCPSAALLLETCVQMADVGDDIEIDLVYGDGSRTEYVLKWPFPMYIAVEVTTPALRDPDHSAIEFFGIVEQFDADQGIVDISSEHGDGPTGKLPTLAEPRQQREPFTVPPGLRPTDPGMSLLAAFLGGLSVGLWMAARYLRRVARKR